MTDVLFLSSRGNAPAVTASEAMQQGLAPDGGLYVPTAMPPVDVSMVAALTALPDIAYAALQGFFRGDRLEHDLADVMRRAFDFAAPLSSVSEAPERLFALELFHGPTAAFKDFGARFLAESLQHLQGLDSAGQKPLTILVATSGDTGGAVAAAFHLRPWVRIVVLYPKGLVSPRQEQQLTCWGDNVISLRIDGSFDDCQRLVKEAFMDVKLTLKHRFSSANSINIGRLLPQMAYYIASSLEVARNTGKKPCYIIPAGNLGNAFAAVWARALGFPIHRIVLAHNANLTVPDFLQSGDWLPRRSVPTLASAMDVGNPSNMERLRSLYPSITSLREQLSADSVSDADIRGRIAEDFARYGREWCPHTATAAEIYSRLSATEKREHPWVLVATAHPAKFNDVVEPVIGKAVDVPQALDRLLRLPRHFVDLPPTLQAVAAALQ